MCGSFRLDNTSTPLRRVGRCNSTMAASEFQAAARITAYERLSKSMRMAGNPPPAARSRRPSRAWSFVVRVFSPGKQSGEDTTQMTPAVKKRLPSSWIPNPHAPPLAGSGMVKRNSEFQVNDNCIY